MLSIALRLAVTLAALWLISNGLFAWRWPARWRLPARPGGTVNQPIDNRYATGDENQGTLGAVLFGVIALLIALGVLLVVLM